MTAPKARLRLVPERCDACGRCVLECPSKAVRVGMGYIYVDWARCDGCGQCGEWCDREAIVPRTEGGPAPVPAAPRPAAPREPARRPRREWPEPAADVDWRWWEVALPVALMTAFIAVGRGPLGVGLARGLKGSALTAALTAWSAAFYVAPLVALVLLPRRKGVSFAAAYGLRATRPRPAALAVALSVAGCLLGVGAYTTVLYVFGWRNPQISLTRIFGTGLSGLLLSIAVAVVLGPVTEELLMRGLLLSSLRRRFSAVTAIVLSGMLFGAYHVYPWTLLPSALIGMVAGWLYVSYRSLWPAIAFHGLFNLMTVLAQFYLRNV